MEYNLMQTYEQARITIEEILTQLGVKLILTTPIVNMQTKQIDYTFTLQGDKESISGQYHTGLGWVTKNVKQAKEELASGISVALNADGGVVFVNLRRVQVDNKPVNSSIPAYRICKPSVVDIVYSLCLESEAVDMNFSDWCANLGYSDDSIKDLNLYQTCVKNGKDIRKLLGSRYQEISELAREL